MKCNNCNIEIDSKDKYCSNCGNMNQQYTPSVQSYQNIPYTQLPNTYTQQSNSANQGYVPIDRTPSYQQPQSYTASQVQQSPSQQTPTYTPNQSQAMPNYGQDAKYQAPSYNQGVSNQPVSPQMQGYAYGSYQQPQMDDDIMIKKYSKIMRDENHPDNMNNGKRVFAAVILSIVFIAIVLLLSQYSPILPETTNTDVSANIGTVQQSDSILSKQVNENASFGNIVMYNDLFYIGINGEIIEFNNELEETSVITTDYAENISVDDTNIYYIDYNNDYIAYNKETSEKEILLNNVYYVHNINGTIYYQNDSENETIYKMTLNDRVTTQLNDEISYVMLIDEENNIIYYMTFDNELKSIDMQGDNEELLIDYIDAYCLSDDYIFYLKDGDLYQYHLSNGDDNIYLRNGGLRYVNYSNGKIYLSSTDSIIMIDEEGRRHNLLELESYQFIKDVNVIGDHVFYCVGNNYYVIDNEGDRKVVYEDYISLYDYRTDVYPNFESQIEEY